MPWEDLLARPILLVSGKGGTGKSTVAAALATYAAQQGRRVLLTEVEGRGEAARTLGVIDPGFRERPTPLGFNVLSIVPAEAAVEYLRLFSGLGRVARPALTSAAWEQVVRGGPGIRDLLACGKLYEIVRLRAAGHPRAKGRPRYDLVVVDAPPTGQIAGFLAAPSSFAELIRVGRMRRQAAAIAGLLRSEAQVALTSIPEEMSVAETLEAIPAIRATGAALGGVVVNRCLPPTFPRGTLPTVRHLAAADLRTIIADAGLELTEDTATALRVAAEEEETRRKTQRGFVRKFASAGLGEELPDLSGIEGPPLVQALAGVMAGDPAAPHSDRASSRDDAEPVRVSLPGRLGRHIEGAEVIVVCGSGGVGKTTVAAAIAVHVAPGRGTAALLTVDPARRLATALRLPLVAGDRARLRLGRGAGLEVMQLDTQRTFDEVIERYGGSRERKDRILSNRFYRRISDTLAGTHEYMAMEKLYTLAEEEDHDAIVIDTPPTRSALSFLDAPTRLTEFLGGRVLRWMVRPSARAGRLTLSAARLGAGAFLRTFGRVLGTEVLADTVEFLSAFEGMYGGFADRAERVLALLRSERCAFVVVTAPTTASLEEAAFFVDRLTENGMRPAAVVVNRWHRDLPSLPQEAGRVAEDLAAGSGEQRAAGAVLAAAVRRHPRVAAEGAAVATFIEGHPRIPLLGIPELAGDVHDVPGLRRVAGHLFGDGVGRS
jgi:anion-transporting  ArsA/GET3 family ATPase